MDAPFSSHPSSAPLSGALSPDSLVRVLRDVHLGGLTGVLALSRGRERLGLRFLAGRIVSGTDGPVGRLGDILLRLGQLSQSDLGRALEKAAIEGVRLGPVLVAERMASREQVQEALRLQVRDVLFAAFFWGFGAHRFDPDDGPGLDEDINLEMSTPGLIFDVVSCLEAPRVCLEGLASLSEAIAVDAGLTALVGRDGVRLGLADEHVLARADGVTPIRQILEGGAFPRLALERSLVALLCCGGVRPLPAPPAVLTGPDQTLPLPRAPRASVAPRLPSPDETVALPRASLGVDAIEQKRRAAALLLQHMEQQTHFAVLGLPEGASSEDVKRAFVRLAKRYHPDTVRDPELGVLTKAIFLRVSEASNVLASPDSRARYERRLGGRSKIAAAPPAPPLPVPPPHAAPVVAAPVVAPSPPPAPKPPRVAAVPLEEPAAFADPALVVRRAESLLAAGDPFEAATLLTDVLPHTEGRLHQRALLLRARAYLRTPSGSHLAESDLRDLLRDDPGVFECWVLLGDIYRSCGLARRAEAQYRRALELRPGDPGATAQLAALSRPADGPARAARR